MGFRVLVSLHPAIQATGRLTFAPAGLIPAEHTSLRWTHKRSQFRDPAPMTSLKQIEANRRNALKSTGPRSENGKQRSRRNAVRHGLTAETTITEAGSCAPTGYYALGRLESATFAPRLHLFRARLGDVEIALVRLQLGHGHIY